MGDSAEDFARKLEARFQREHAHIEPQPFVRLTLERVAAERARVAFVRRVTWGLALIAVIVASPWLIAGSVHLTAALNELFHAASGWLATPAGMGGTVLATVAVAVLYRWRAWRRTAIPPGPTE